MTQPTVETTESAGDELRVPLEWRLVFSLPLGPLATGLLVTGLCLGSYALLIAVLGMRFESLVAALEFFVDDTGRTALLISLFLGYTCGAVRWDLRERYRDLRELGFEVRDAEPGSEELRAMEATPADIARSRVAAVCAALVGLAIVALIWSAIGDDERQHVWRAGFGWFVPVLPLLFWFFGRTAYFTMSGSLKLPGAAAFERGVDLFDLRPQLLAGRVALRLSLLWIVALSLGSLLILTPGTAVVVAPTLVSIALVGAVALLVPVRDVHRQIAEARREELARIHDVLSPLREPALRGDAEAQQRLAGLLAYRAQVSAISEWPFDAPALFRFALFLLIPVASWLGGALVERGVDALLD